MDVRVILYSSSSFGCNLNPLILSHAGPYIVTCMHAWTFPYVKNITLYILGYCMGFISMHAWCTLIIIIIAVCMYILLNMNYINGVFSEGSIVGAWSSVSV